MHIETIWKFRTVQVYSVVPHTNHMTDHPITPSPELVRQWQREANHNEPMFQQVANQAAQWGADQQLTADAKWLDCNALNEPHLRITSVGESLKEAMRPKSSKEQALEAIAEMADCMKAGLVPKRSDLDIIRKALETLND